MTTPYEQTLAARREQAERKRKKDRKDAVTRGVLATFGILIAVVAVVLLLSVVTMLAWNLGVVALAAACGGHVGHIGLVTALFANAALGIIKQPFVLPKGGDSSS